MNETANLTAARSEAKQQAQRIDHIVERGRDIVVGSNLTRDGSVLSPRDITTTRQLLETVAPRTEENGRLWDHIDLTAKVARRFGVALQEAQPDTYADLDIHRIEILGLFQDFGRHITHRWLRNEKVATNAMRRLGIRSDIVDSIPSVDIYVDKDPNDINQITQTIDDMTTEERIIEMADLYAKRDPEDPLRIRPFSEVLAFHYASRKNYRDYTKLSPLFPSEKELNTDVIDFSAAVYNRLHVWFAKQGVDLERERQWLMTEESVQQ